MKGASKLASAVKSSLPSVGSVSWSVPSAPPPPPPPCTRASVASSRPPPAPAVWLSKVAVAARFGVNPKTIRRWLDDPELGFPRPRDFNGRDMFKRVEIEAWENSRPRN